MAESPPLVNVQPSTTRLLLGAVLLGFCFTLMALLFPWVVHVHEHPERLPLLIWLVRLAGFGAYVVAGGWIGYRLQQRSPQVSMAAVVRLALIAGLLLALLAWILSLLHWTLVAGQSPLAFGIGYWLMRTLWTLVGLGLAVGSALVMSRIAGIRGTAG